MRTAGDITSSFVVKIDYEVIGAILCLGILPMIFNST